MAELFLALVPWMTVLVGFVGLNWFAIHQIEKRFYYTMENRDERLTRMRKAMRALRDARAASRRDRIDKL